MPFFLKLCANVVVGNMFHTDFMSKPIFNMYTFSFHAKYSCIVRVEVKLDSDVIVSAAHFVCWDRAVQLHRYC